MARGWESKSVEAQMEEAEAPSVAKPRLSPQEIEAKQQRETLLLTKKKFEADLERSSNERHREILKRALVEVDKQLASL
jgi:hypothetical protein